MPIIRILTTAGNTPEKKRRIAERIREEVVKIYDPPKGTTVVLFEEFDADNIHDPEARYMVPVKPEQSA